MTGQSVLQEARIRLSAGHVLWIVVRLSTGRVWQGPETSVGLNVPPGVTYTQGGFPRRAPNILGHANIRQNGKDGPEVYLASSPLSSEATDSAGSAAGSSLVTGAGASGSPTTTGLAGSMTSS